MRKPSGRPAKKRPPSSSLSHRQRHGNGNGNCQNQPDFKKALRKSGVQARSRNGRNGRDHRDHPIQSCRSPGCCTFQVLSPARISCTCTRHVPHHTFFLPTRPDSADKFDKFIPAILTSARSFEQPRFRPNPPPPSHARSHPSFNLIFIPSL